MYPLLYPDLNANSRATTNRNSRHLGFLRNWDGISSKQLQNLVQFGVLRLISEEILNEYKEVLARHRVRRELIGAIINLLREEATLVAV
jgi:predicted nucleic acid-binding protein